MAISDRGILELFRLAIKLKRIDHGEDGERLFSIIAAPLQEASPDDYKIGLSLFGPPKPLVNKQDPADPAQPEAALEARDAAPPPGEKDEDKDAHEPLPAENAGSRAPENLKEPGISYTIDEEGSEFDIHPVKVNDVDVEAWSHYNMGVTYLRMGMADEARAELAHAVEAGGEPAAAAREILKRLGTES